MAKSLKNNEVTLEDRILASMRPGILYARGDLMEWLDITPLEWKLTVPSMVDSGKLTRHGTKRGTRYQLAGSQGPAENPIRLLSERAKEVLHAFEAEQEYSRSELLERLDISVSAWNRAIAELVDNGVVRREGDRRGARYQLADFQIDFSEPESEGPSEGATDELLRRMTERIPPPLRSATAEAKSPEAKPTEVKRSKGGRKATAATSRSMVFDDDEDAVGGPAAPLTPENNLGEQAKRPIDKDLGEQAKRPIDKDLGEQAKCPIDKDLGEQAKCPIDKKTEETERAPLVDATPEPPPIEASSPGPADPLTIRKRRSSEVSEPSAPSAEEEAEANASTSTPPPAAPIAPVHTAESVFPGSTESGKPPVRMRAVSIPPSLKPKRRSLNMLRESPNEALRRLSQAEGMTHPAFSPGEAPTPKPGPSSFEPPVTISPMMLRRERNRSVVGRFDRDDHQLAKDLGLASVDRVFSLLATHGIPREFWAACSALFNHGGGVLLLGARKRFGGSTFIKGIRTPGLLLSALLAELGQREAISRPPFGERNLRVIKLADRSLLRIDIAARGKGEAPCYVGLDSFSRRPMEGIFRIEDGELLKCNLNEVKQHWREWTEPLVPLWTLTPSTAEQLSENERPASNEPRPPAKDNGQVQESRKRQGADLNGQRETPQSAPARNDDETENQGQSETPKRRGVDVRSTARMTLERAANYVREHPRLTPRTMQRMLLELCAESSPSLDELSEAFMHHKSLAKRIDEMLASGQLRLRNGRYFATQASMGEAS
ncbi:MAG: winged helix-turn-helix domain-containing protein [Myxococcota bacterium]|jgi:predicted transcriptional regulator|nr:winged helix-turn-helix domain-containing protein [Myxococcota bacterium]